MVWSWVFLFLKSDFFPGFLCAVEQKWQSKRQGADANGPGPKELGVGGGCVCVCRRGDWWWGAEGVLLWKQPQGQTEHDQRPSDALKCNWRKKKPKRKKKIIKRGPKQDSQFLTRTKNKNVFKVKPWEQRGPWLQPDKSRQADEEQGGGGNERQQRTKAHLTQLCYHLYVGSTFCFLTEWKQWQ